MKKYITFFFIQLSLMSYASGQTSCTSDVKIVDDSIEGISACVLTVSSTSNAPDENHLKSAAVEAITDKMDENCSLAGKFFDPNSLEHKSLLPGMMDNLDGTISWFNSTRSVGSCK